MKVKTADLIGSALDWAVAQCEWGNKFANSTDLVQVARRQGYSTNWAQSGPIIEREGINLSVDYQDDWLTTDMVQIGWKANLWNNSVPGTAGFLQWAYGPTPLIAAMRCFVASRLGDEVDIPEELLT